MKKNIVSLISILFITLLLPCVSFSQTDIDFERLSEEAKDEEASAIAIEDEYRKWLITHQKRVFGWNHVSSVIIFFFVMAIITMGLYFSYIQFRESIHTAQNKDLSPSTMKIGQSGVEISSSIVGLLILIVSLAFFYLYLENVYPVQITPAAGTSVRESELSQ